MHSTWAADRNGNNRLFCVTLRCECDTTLRCEFDCSFGATPYQIARSGLAAAHFLDFADHAMIHLSTSNQQCSVLEVTRDSHVHRTSKVQACIWFYQGRNERGKGTQFQGRRITMVALNHCGGAEWLRGAPKSPNNVTSTFLNTVHLLPKDLKFEHGGPKLTCCHGRHLTSLRRWILLYLVSYKQQTTRICRCATSVHQTQR